MVKKSKTGGIQLFTPRTSKSRAVPPPKKREKMGKDGLYPSERILISMKLQLPSGYLSPTQIEMYLRCPRQYEFRYVLGEKRPPEVAMVEGGSHHVALAFNNEHRRNKGRNLTAKKVSDRFCDDFRGKSKEIEDWGEESVDAVVSRGRKLLATYMKEIAPHLTPDLVEERVEWTIGPVPMVGVIDVDGDKKGQVGVWDYKVVGRIKSDAEVAGSIQLSSYSDVERQVYGVDRFETGFICLLKNTGKVVVQSIPSTARRVKWYRRVVLSVADAISRGSFPPTAPFNWACDPRWCGYYGICRGAYE